MCGIAGAFGFGPTGTLPAGLGEAMANTLRHRGPDGAGAFEAAGVALGHRRLSIIDLSAAAAQPMPNEDGSLQLLFNGEIYNFAALRAELERSGHRFRSHGDGEVILHLYEEQGARCVERLEGMFAFCLYDARAHQLLLARDRIGEKPLYYASDRGTFYFASEIKALFAAGVPRRLSPEGIGAYLHYVQIPAPTTIFEGVRKLEPGHVLRVDRTGAGRSEPYWRLDFTGKAGATADEAEEQLHQLLRDAVGKMLVSDVPVGMMLSGGVDSTLILAIARELGAADLHTFTVGNGAAGVVDEEAGRARRMAARFGVANHVVDFGAATFEELRRAAAACDEPIGMLELFYHCGILRHISRHVKVVLSGNGADELFGGYSTYNGVARLSTALAWLRPVIGRANTPINRLAAGYYVRRNEAALRPYLRDLSSAHSRASARLLERGMSVSHYDNLLDAKLFADLSVLGNHGLSGIPDTASMTNSLELRSPFLHGPIIEFAASLPLSFKIGDVGSPVHNKRIVKSLLTRYVPREDVYAPKYGFGYFINCFDLLKTTWRADAEATLRTPGLRDLGIFDLEGIERTWRRFLDRGLEFRERLILARFLMFATWHAEVFAD